MRPLQEAASKNFYENSIEFLPHIESYQNMVTKKSKFYSSFYLKDKTDVGDSSKNFDDSCHCCEVLLADDDAFNLIALEGVLN